LLLGCDLPSKVMINGILPVQPARKPSLWAVWRVSRSADGTEQLQRVDNAHKLSKTRVWRRRPFIYCELL